MEDSKSSERLVGDCVFMTPVSRHRKIVLYREKVARRDATRSEADFAQTTFR
jgi:hypothetical protein